MRKKMRNKLVMVISTLLIVCIVSVPVYALSNSNPLSMTKYTQQKSSWCWAACAQMVGKYFGSSYTQSQIVTNVKGSAVNQGGSDREVTLALQYVTIGQGYSVVYSGVPTFATIKTNIVNNHYPVVAKITWDSGGAHAEVITGTNSSSQVYLVDPLNSNQWVSYTSLKSGVKLNSGTGKLSVVWKFSK